MVTRSVWFAILPIALLIVGGEVWTSAVNPARAFPRPDTAVFDIMPSPPPRSAKPRLDLYGNPVENAVGEYRIDVRGDVYENHSPDTEVPRLGPPIL